MPREVRRRIAQVLGARYAARAWSSVRGDPLRLPNASGDPARSTGNLPDMRDGSRARAAERRGRGESRAGRLSTALLVDAASQHHRHLPRDVRASARLVRYGDAELHRVRAVGAGRSLGWMAVLMRPRWPKPT
ncbi:MAG: hypothetical protein WC538_03375 [Thermoanaerobaculia bacterium]